jgi:hypothetical protein
MPTNTLQAIYNIAHNPSAVSPSGILGLASANPAFQPKLSSAPNDWTLAVNYSNGASYAPAQLAIDSNGTVWTVNKGTGGSASSVSVLSNQGALAFTPLTTNSMNFQSGVDLYGANAIAIANTGTGGSTTALVLNQGSNSITAINLNSGAGSYFYNYQSTYCNTTCENQNNGAETIALNSPTAITVDSNSNIWVANSNGTVVEIPQSQSSGANVFSPSGLSSPTGIAADGTGNVWISNENNSPSNDSVVQIVANGGLATPGTGGGLYSPYAIAIDSQGNAWVPNVNGGSISKFSASGLTISPVGSGYSGGGTGGGTFPRAIALDGANNVWVANFGSGGSLSEFNSSGTALTPSSGLGTSSGMTSPVTLAIDGSGNLWTGNNVPGGGAGTITEFIGLAAPVITPLPRALATSQLATEPGTPQPMTILTTALPPFVSAANYFAGLQASGGSGLTSFYSWTLNSQTGGPVSLSSSGSVTGTPTTSGSITVTVRDTSTGGTAQTTLPLTEANTWATTQGANDSEISGPYAFMFNTVKTQVTGANEGIAAMLGYVGHIYANGAGQITAGVLDTNQPGTVSTQASLTGYYTLGSDNRGMMTLTYGTHTLVFTIAAGNIQSGVANTLTLLSFVDTGITISGTGTNVVGGGIAKLQNPAAFTSTTMTNNFVFGFTGETPCTSGFSGSGGSAGTGCPLTGQSPYGPLSSVGEFSVNGSGVTGGREDAQADNLAYGWTASPVNMGIAASTSNYTNPNATTGHGTLALSLTGSNLLPDPPTNYSYYVVNANEIFLLSIDTHLSYSLLFGDALAKAISPSSFSTSTLSGSILVAETAAQYSSFNNSGYPTGSSAGLYAATITSPGNISLFQDANYEGIVSSYAIGSTTYSVDSGITCGSATCGGRMTIQAGSGSPTFYLNGATAGTVGFATDGGNPGLLLMEAQAPLSFSTSTLSGTYIFGPPYDPAPISGSSGVVNVNGANTTATADVSVPSGILETGVTGSGTYTVNSTTGRGVLTNPITGGSSVLYILSPTSALVMDTSINNGTPTVQLLQK